MKTLAECEWEIEIKDVKFSKEVQGIWWATCKSMDGYQFANGGVGSIESVRLFETPKRAREGWIEFAKVNGIKNYKFKK